ncbi:glycosyltransferase [Bdellovibrio sp. HCB209]|uniref:glycosyltransferase n=1 Tax=Bdellovibrio sp. HCB209 TaxID=3394354 RepID=UPI0039B4ACA2
MIVRDDLGSANFLKADIPAGIDVHYLFAPGEANVKRYGFRGDLLNRLNSILDKISPYHLIVDFSPVLEKVMPRLKDKNIVLWMHGDKSHMGFCERMKYLFRIRHYKSIVLLCPEMEAQFYEIFPSLKNKFKVIPNPFDFKKIHDRADDLSEFNEFEKDLIQKPYVVSVARFVPGKDIKSIIEAGRINKSRGIHYRHYIVGDGEQRNAIQAIIKSNDVQDMFVLLGAKKNPYPWIKNAQFFVHSAIREGFGLVIVEAMSLGRPVIATRCPVGPKDILDGGAYGQMFDVKDHVVLADLIAKYLENSSERSKYAKLSLERSTVYSREAIVPKLYDLFESF